MKKSGTQGGSPKRYILKRLSHSSIWEGVWNQNWRNLIKEGSYIKNEITTNLYHIHWDYLQKYLWTLSTCLACNIPKKEILEESSHKKMFLRKNLRIVFFDKINLLTFTKIRNSHFKRWNIRNIEQVLFVLNKQRFFRDSNSKILR